MKISFTLKYVAFMLLVIPAVLRVFVLLSPNPYFMFDPRAVAIPGGGLGPSGMMLLDVLSMAGFVFAIINEHRSGRSIHILLCILAIIPLVSIGRHVLMEPAIAGVTTSSIEYNIKTAQDAAATFVESVDGNVNASGWDHQTLITGSAWFAAILTAIGAFHLGRDPHMRVAIVSSVVAVAIPLAIKGIYQVLVEHPINVDEFAQNKNALLAAQGWTEDSSQALLFERRLSQPEATGWFGLSNVYGSLLAAFATFWIAATLSAARTRLASGWLGVLGLITAVTMVGLAFSFSKGAIIAAVLGLMLAGCILIPRRYRRRISSWTFRITIALVIITFLLVIIRGGVFGELWTDKEKSVLFRWQYMIGSWRTILHHPIFGVGPGGFKTAYLLFKPPISPEEVSTPHNIILTWLATLGMMGFAWCMLLGILVYHASPMPRLIKSKSNKSDTPDTSELNAKSSGVITDTALTYWPERLKSWQYWLPAILIGLPVFILASIINAGTMLLDYAYLFWPLGFVGYIAASAILPWVGRHTAWAMLRWAGWASVTVLVVHSQIEMTLSQPGSAAIVLLLIGALAATRPVVVSPKKDMRTHPLLQLICIGCAVCVTIGHLFLFAIPIIRQQSEVRNAADELAPLGEIRMTLNRTLATQDINALLDGFQEVSDILSAQQYNPKVAGRLREIHGAMQLGDHARVRRLVQSVSAQVHASLSHLELSLLESTLPVLYHADSIQPGNLDLAKEIVKTHVLLARIYARRNDNETQGQEYEKAVIHAARSLLNRPNQTSTYTAIASIYSDWAAAFDDDSIAIQALPYRHAATELDPHNMHATLALADLYQLLGEDQNATQWYQRTLDIDRMLFLDPLRQLSDKERKRIEDLL